VALYENEEEILEECIECGHLYPADEVIDGICQNCRDSSHDSNEENLNHI
jgi:hypothetical protein